MAVTASPDPAPGIDQLPPTGRPAPSGSLVELAPCYWPALLLGRRAAATGEHLAQASSVWEALTPRRSFANVWRGELVLLYAGDIAGPAQRPRVERAVGRVVQALRNADRPLGAWAILAERSVAIDQLALQVRRLERLRHFDGTSGHGAVVDVHSLALDCLLERIGPNSTHAFVRDYIGALIDADRQSGIGLAHTLKLALEHPRRDDAARAAFMHRNTFRRRLQKALEYIDSDLEDPDQRFALLLALRLYGA